MRLCGIGLSKPAGNVGQQFKHNSQAGVSQLLAVYAEK